MFSQSRVAHILVATCSVLVFSTASFAQQYVQTNLVSDIAQPANANGTPVSVDPDLVNAWGLARGASSPWWVNNGGTGTSTLYTGAGAAVPLIVTIPNSQGVAGPSVPTGMVFNGTADFNLAANNPAAFIFATKNGTIAAWGPPATAVVGGRSTAITKVDEGQAGAVFTGLTWVEFNGAHFLLAANFRENQIEVFDRNFTRASLPGQFQDTTRPSGFAPYNIQAVGPLVVVTYAKQNAAQTAPVDAGGIVAVFNAEGRFLFELQNGPWFRAPWGVALAPRTSACSAITCSSATASVAPSLRLTWRTGNSAGICWTRQARRSQSMAFGVSNSTIAATTRQAPQQTRQPARLCSSPRESTITRMVCSEHLHPSPRI
jgi:uncharacterized protein (TIGR03118 family)